MISLVKQMLNDKPRSVKMLTQFSMGMFGMLFFALALILDEPTEQQNLVSAPQAIEAAGGSSTNDEPEQSWRTY